MSFEAIQKFHQTYYQNQPFTYCIMGSKEKLDLKDLEKIGKVKVLSLEDIFGY
jgi:hypothetical protein